MNQPPRLVALLGYGGLLPFGLGALGLLFMPTGHALWQTLLLAYAAIILSFVGALHWGFAMGADASDAPGLYSWSVVPALLGWAGLRCCCPVCCPCWAATRARARSWPRPCSSWPMPLTTCRTGGSRAASPCPPGICRCACA